MPAPVARASLRRSGCRWPRTSPLARGSQLLAPDGRAGHGACRLHPAPNTAHAAIPLEAGVQRDPLHLQRELRHHPGLALLMSRSDNPLVRAIGRIPAQSSATGTVVNLASRLCARSEEHTSEL